MASCQNLDFNDDKIYGHEIDKQMLEISQFEYIECMIEEDI